MYGVVLKIERFFYLLDRFFGLSSPVVLKYLIIGAFIENWYVVGKGYLVPQERVRIKSYLEREPFMDIRLL